MPDSHFRRDPRRERVARNRMHQDHQAVTASGPERGPSGLIRRNLHLIGFVGPNGIKRIDRLGGNGAVVSSGRRHSQETQAAVLPLHQVENPDYLIAVVPDMVGGMLSSHDRDVLGMAHKLIGELGGKGAVLAVVFGEYRETAFDLAGVDRLLHLDADVFAHYAPEAQCDALALVNATLAPRFWLFPESMAGGFELGRRLAARLHERPATQAWQVSPEATVSRGASGSLDIHRATPKVLLLAEECAEPIDETRHEVLPVTLEAALSTTPSIIDEGLVAVDPNAIALGEAEFILSAGNGVHDWPQFHKAAEVLGATEGASRVAVDNGDMPRERQVGATGTWVTARVYVAVGISGAIQHLQGIEKCDKVVAINTDIGCDMVKRAALSVIADSSEVLAELMRLVEDYRSKEVDNAA